jgi:hypothetical protein
MLLIFGCEHCGKRFRVDDRYQGRKGRCKYCHEVVVIRGSLVPKCQPLDEPTCDIELIDDDGFKAIWN